MPNVRLIKHEAISRSAAAMRSAFPMAARRDSSIGTTYQAAVCDRRVVDRAVAERVAKIFARAEQRRLDLDSQVRT